MTSATSQFAEHVGIDWASDKHDVCIQTMDSKREFIVLSHTPEAIDDWAQSLYRRCKGQIAVAIELCKGPIIYALQKYSFITIFPVNPTMLARYREAFSPSGAKGDPTDAEIALDLILSHPKQVKPLKIQSESMRKLMFLVEQRRRLVDGQRRGFYV